MNIKRILARNAIWNMAGMACGMVTGFFIAPFLIRSLGDTTYALWILIGSLTGYFGLLDFGVRCSVGRYVAYHHARGELEAVNTTLATAFTLLCAAAALVLLGTLGISLVFFRLFAVPPDQAENVRLAMILVGVNLAVSFPLNLFDATLWAFQRFDALNAVDIPCYLLRTILTFVLIGRGHDLVTLATLALATTVLMGLGKMVISFRLDPRLRLTPALSSRATARDLYSYGIWHLLLQSGLMFSAQVPVVIVGAFVSVPLVTAYSIGTRLVSYVISIQSAFSGILTPVAAVLEAEEKHERQQQLFLRGGQASTAFALYAVAAMLLLGRPFIALWVGRDVDSAAGCLGILALGELLPLSQAVTHGLIMAKNRHRFMACIGFVELLGTAGLTWLWFRPYGVYGASAAYAVSHGLCRGIIQLIYGCRITGVSVASYTAVVLLLPALAAILPVAGLAWMVEVANPDNWLTLVGEGALFTLLFGFFFGVGFVPASVFRSLRVRALGLLSGQSV